MHFHWWLIDCWRKEELQVERTASRWNKHGKTEARGRNCLNVQSACSTLTIGRRFGSKMQTRCAAPRKSSWSVRFIHVTLKNSVPLHRKHTASPLQKPSS
jgi:hypothetical protein